jgi:hypothetical protein
MTKTLSFGPWLALFTSACATVHAAAGAYRGPISSAWVEEARVPYVRLVAVQDPLRRRAWLSGERDGQLMPPDLPLAGVLMAQGKGAILTVCGRAEREACLPPARLALDPMVGRIDEDGVLHLARNLDLGAQPQLEALRQVQVTVQIVGGPTVVLRWPLRLRAEPLVFVGSQPESPGADGPDLDVQVDARDTERWRFVVRKRGETFTAVVDVDQLGGFAITSRGGAGQWDAGTALSRHGAEGGNGGKVRARVACAPSHCAEVVARVRGLLRSEGGAGGIANLASAEREAASGGASFVGADGTPGRPGAIDVVMAKGGGPPSSR